MKKYIDREALLNRLEESSDTWWKGLGRSWWAHSVILKDNFVSLIREAPTADVVEVVRKPVVGYEGHYVVDQFGRVYGIDRTVTVLDNGRIYEKPIAGKQMKQFLHTKGYKTVSLTKDGKTKTVFVHRLVAEAFVPNDDGLPMINHKDEDKTNNFAENLEWCTASYNRTYGKAIQKHARKLRGKKHSEEHKKKISEGVKRSYGERKEHE
jgi:hypothetical protein